MIKESELPNTFSWDVSRSVSNARNENQNYVTLVVSTVPLKHVENLPYTSEFVTKLGTSLAWIWSGDLKNYGANAAPTLIVIYEESNSNLWNSIEFALIALLPAIAVVIPGAFWIMQQKNKKNNV